MTPTTLKNINKTFNADFPKDIVSEDPESSADEASPHPHRRNTIDLM